MLNYTSDSSRPLAEELRDRLASEHGITAHAVQADIGSREGPKALMAQVLALFPGPPQLQVDILIHNAGIAINNELADVTISDFERTYAVNVLGPLLLTQLVLPYLPHDRSGRIIGVSSVSSATGFVGQSVYGGTKAALEAMVRTWARELSERCTCNCVDPGPVEGPMYAANTDEFKRQIRGWIEHTPLMRARPGVDSDEIVETARREAGGGRPAYVHEIAGIVAMLCTPDAAWCTGQVVSANGGMLMKR